MEKHLLSYWKKPEQHKDSCLVIGEDKGKELYRKTYIFIKNIIPNRVIKDKNVYEITYLDKMFNLDGFEISTENNKVINIRVFGFHPNCDPNTDNFCIPDFKKGVELTNKYLSLIISNIQTYYLDTCFFNPTGNQLKYKKMKSIYIQFNK